MDKKYFVGSIKKLRDSCVRTHSKSLLNPPGRKPRKSLVDSSTFFNSLNEEQKEKVKKIMMDSIDQAFFSFFCVLDHVGFIEDTEEKTEFELYAVKNGERVLINDPKQEELHNLYNELTLDVD